MSDEPVTPGARSNPLAGVLGRLLDRERGCPGEQTAAEPENAPQPDLSVSLQYRPEDRRMLVIAGPGTGLGDAAMRSAVQWTTLLGKRPVVTDLCCGRIRNLVFPQDPDTQSTGERIPRASVPCELDRVRREPAEVVLALLDRLRRHEFASDLSLVRLPIHQRRALMRAAFLSGALVLPVEESDPEFREAVDVARELVQNFLEISIWPFARLARTLERFLAAVPGEVQARATPFDPGQLDLASRLEQLVEPPREGFLVGLLAPEPADLPPELYQVDTLQI